MNKQRKPKEYRAKPPIKGIIECDYKHRWSVADLNPEQKSRKCPVCGTMTDIQKGLQHD